MSKIQEATAIIDVMGDVTPEDYMKYYKNFCESLFIRSNTGYQSFDRAFDLAHLALGLAGESGEVADHFKKFIRDGQDHLDKNEEKVKKELGDVYWYLILLTFELGWNPLDVIEANMLHLARRKDEDKIQGSGSDR